MKKNTKKQGTTMRKRVSFSSLGVKIPVMLLMVLIVTISVIGGMTYRTMYSALDMQINNNIKETNNQVKYSIDRFFEDKSNSIGLFSINKELLEIAERSNGNIIETDRYGRITSGLGDYIEENALKLLQDFKTVDDDVLFVYVATDEKDIVMYPPLDLTDEFDPTSRPWYKKAMKNKGKVVWSGAYIEASTKEMVVTAAKTMEKDGKIVGVVGCDITIKTLSDMVKTIKVGNTGYVTILDDTGTILAHPDPELMALDTKELLKSGESDVWDFVSQSNEGSGKYILEDTEKKAAFTTNSADWKIITSYYPNELSDILSYTKQNFAIVLLAALVIGSIVSYIIVRGLLKNISIINRAFESASQGDLKTRINIKSKDELGFMGQNFNLMMENITILLQKIKKSAEVIGKTSDNLSSMSKQTANAINEVATTVEEIASSTLSQAEQTNGGVDKATELEKSVDEVSSSIGDMTKMFNRTTEVTENGLSILKNLLEETEKTERSTNNVNEIIGEVNESSENIGAIVNTITNIAEQTNLLALNASIESARAGEAGKGFAVVANEIKKLAEQTSEATGEIRELIESIQRNSQNAVNGMGEAKDTIADQVNSVKNTEKAFYNISDIIKKIVDNIGYIQKLNDTMIVKKDEIISSMESISVSAQQNSAGTQQASASAQEILATTEAFTEHISELNHLVEGFNEEIGKFSLE